MNDKTVKPGGEPETQGKGGVVAKLKKYKDAHSGMETFTLPATGISVTYPKFRNHQRMMKAAAMAKNSPTRMQVIYVTENCRFDGEKLTTAEFTQLLPDDDSNALIKLLFGENVAGDDDDAFGDDNDGDTEGNAKTA